MDERIEQIHKDYQIVAAVGLKAPKLDIPFLTIEHFLQKEGKILIQQLVDANVVSINDNELVELIDDNFTFVNTKKILPLLMRVYQDCKNNWHGLFNNTLKVNLIMHLAGMIERLLQGANISANDTEMKEIEKNPNYQTVKKALNNLSEQLNIQITETEVYYVLQLLDTL